MDINENAMSIGMKDGVLFEIILTSNGHFIKEYNSNNHLQLTPISESDAIKMRMQSYKHFEKVKRT